MKVNEVFSSAVVDNTDISSIIFITGTFISLSLQVSMYIRINIPLVTDQACILAIVERCKDGKEPRFVSDKHRWEQPQYSYQ